MGIDIKAECERAGFLDWIENNKQKLIDYLILEEEEFLLKIYNNKKIKKLIEEMN